MKKPMPAWYGRAMGGAVKGPGADKTAKRAEGGRVAPKKKGEAKTNVNVIIAGKGGSDGPGAPPPMPMPPPSGGIMPAKPPMPMPMPPPGGLPMHKRGGRVKGK